LQKKDLDSSKSIEIIFVKILIPTS